MNIVMKEITHGTPEYQETVHLRNAVFRKPWGLDIKDDDLSPDKEMDIYGAYLNNKLIATVFLGEHEEGVARVRNVAIYEEYRGQGLGRYLMDFIEDIARKKGYTKVYLMGRTIVEEFYHKLGYKTISKAYNYRSIPHLDMIKDL
ncbi:MAG TPA: GNAT family N-acetyltransferase [Syntrophomonadaceae bacterium]|nr:GNAT family N-acetyltransferase [Syntrophomonadaceae bacterium]